ncbi:MAG: hypothetical protein AABZ47_13770 [Planctomycetota bacterium]
MYNTKWTILNLALARLPELDLFETKEQRDYALWEVMGGVPDSKAARDLVPIALASGVIITLLFITGFVCRYLGVSMFLGVPICAVMIFLVTFIVLRLVYRSRGATKLRGKLLILGVPVCRICGYSLKGLVPETGRCPECGKEFEERVLQIMAGTSELRGPGV